MQNIRLKRKLAHPYKPKAKKQSKLDAVVESVSEIGINNQGIGRNQNCYKQFYEKV